MVRLPALRRTRAGVLFLRGGLFKCRPCARVVYSSQSDDSIDSTWRRQQRPNGG